MGNSGKLVRKEYIEFGNMLRERRNSLFLSIRNLADEAGIDEGTLRKYELGKRLPTIPKWRSICELYDVSEEQFLSLYATAYYETHKTEHCFTNYILYIRILLGIDVRDFNDLTGYVYTNVVDNGKASPRDISRINKIFDTSIDHLGLLNLNGSNISDEFIKSIACKAAVFYIRNK